jgi:hypothetical protein
MSMMGPRFTFFLLAAVAFLPLTGCGRGSGVRQFKVHGKVLSQGQPAVGAIVVFHPASSMGAASRFPPRGVVGKDGAFTIGSRTTDDGAPAGDYAVTIIWPGEEDPKKQFDTTPPDRLKNRFNDARHARWNLHIKDGANELEAFNLD